MDAMDGPAESRFSAAAALTGGLVRFGQHSTGEGTGGTPETITPTLQSLAYIAGSAPKFSSG